MKLLVLLCACAALTSAATLPERETVEEKKRFIGAVADFFTHAAHSVANAAQTAAHAVSGAAQTAAHSVAGAAETAAHSVAGAAETAYHAVEGAAHTAIGGITDAAHTVGDAFVDAGQDIASFTSQASIVLGPILDTVAANIGPIAEDLLQQAVQELKDQAPNILKAVGEIGLEKLASKVITSAMASAGKREAPADMNADLEALKKLFAQMVQQRVNNTLQEVHKAVTAAEQFNGMLKQQVEKLKKLIHSGQDVQAAAANFFLNLLDGVRHLVDFHVFDVDIDSLDTIVHDVIQDIEKMMNESPEKRFIFSDAVNLAKETVGQLMKNVELLAHNLLAPTVGNVKTIAQALLFNAGSVTQDLMAQAMKVLTPFEAQLGPLYQQVQALAAKVGVTV